MSRPEPWAKMWWDWYAQRSHVALSFDALHLGGLLLNLAKASPEQRWLLDDSGAAMSLRALAMVARMPGAPRVIERRMGAALQELADAGTMERSAVDGAWGFTEAAWKSQACASRDRTRAYRGRQKERHGDAGSDAPGDGGVTPRSDQRSEDQRKEEKKKKRSEPPPVTEVAPVEPIEDTAAVRMRGHYARLALRLQLHGAESLTGQQWAELRHLAAELGEDIPVDERRIRA